MNPFSNCINLSFNIRTNNALWEKKKQIDVVSIPSAIMYVCLPEFFLFYHCTFVLSGLFVKKCFRIKEKKRLLKKGTILGVRQFLRLYQRYVMMSCIEGRFSQLTQTAFSRPYPPMLSHGFFFILRALKENRLEPD